MQQESEEKQSKKVSKKPKTTSKKTRKKSKGLGDTVEKITEATGIKKVVAAVTDDCGCTARKDKWNKLFPYGKTMTADQKTVWEEQIKDQWGKGTLDANAQKAANTLYRDIYRLKARFTRCGGCLKERLKKLEHAYDAACES